MSNLTRLINTLMIKNSTLTDGALVVDAKVQSGRTSARGGSYTINSGASYDSASVSKTLRPGAYNVSFSDIADRVTPEPVGGVAVLPGQRTTVTALYAQTGFSAYSGGTFVSAGQSANLLEVGGGQPIDRVDVHSGGSVGVVQGYEPVEVKSNCFVDVYSGGIVNSIAGSVGSHFNAVNIEGDVVNVKYAKDVRIGSGGHLLYASFCDNYIIDSGGFASGINGSISNTLCSALISSGGTAMAVEYLSVSIKNGGFASIVRSCHGTIAGSVQTVEQPIYVSSMTSLSSYIGIHLVSGAHVDSCLISNVSINHPQNVVVSSGASISYLSFAGMISQNKVLSSAGPMQNVVVDSGGFIENAIVGVGLLDVKSGGSVRHATLQRFYDHNAYFSGFCASVGLGGTVDVMEITSPQHIGDGMAAKIDGHVSSVYARDGATVSVGQTGIVDSIGVFSACNSAFFVVGGTVGVCDFTTRFFYASSTMAASVFVASGGVVSSFDMNSDGIGKRISVYVGLGGNISAGTVGKYARMHVAKGGHVENIDVHGYLDVASSGYAFNVVSHVGCSITVDEGGYITYA